MTTGVNAVVYPNMLGTRELYTQGSGAGGPSTSNVLELMGQVKTADMATTQMRWSRQARSMNFYAGCTYGGYNQGQWGFSGAYGDDVNGFSFNEIATKCNAVIGRQRQNRKSLRCQSTIPEYDHLSTQYSRILSYCDNKEELSQQFSRGFEKGVITGIAFGEVYLNRRKDILNGEVSLKIWEGRSVIFDPYCRDIWEFSDCRYVWCNYFADKAQVLASYPHARDKILPMSTTANADPTFIFLPEAVSVPMKNSLCVSRVWHQIPTEKKAWINLYTDETLMNVPEKFQNSMYLRETRVPGTVWKLSVVINNQVIEEQEAVDGLEECPFIAFTWDYDPEIQAQQFRVRGLPDPLIDAQWLINRTIIKNHNMLESSINSGWITQENSLVDEDIISRAGEGLNVVFKQDSTPPAKILPTPLPESTFELIRNLRQSIEIASAVKSPLAGPDDKSQSGIMSMVRQDAADTPLQKYFDNADRSLNRLGRLSMQLIAKNWSLHKLGKILHEPPEACQLMKEIDLQDLFLTVEEGIYTSVQKRAEFVNFVEVCAMLGVKIPVKLGLQKAPINGTEELTAALEEVEKSQQEAQAQQLAIELGLKEAEIKKINAQALEQLNMAASHHARAGSYAGLENERNAEVSKNESTSTKNNVESLVKLQPLIDMYGLDKIVELLSALKETPILEHSDGKIETELPTPTVRPERGSGLEIESPGQQIGLFNGGTGALS